jgi:hypothetical protein
MNLTQAEQNLVEKYNLDLSVDNFAVASGVHFTDQAGKVVKVVEVIQKDSSLHTDTSRTAEILVCAADGFLLGWVSILDVKYDDKSIEIIIPTQNLSPMPNDFHFTTKCAHLAEWGGIWTGGSWQCFGCGVAVK